MARTRSRLPGLQVPSNVDPEIRLFMEAVKERLELMSGERGDPNARALTVTDSASLTSSSSAAAAEELDLSLLTRLPLEAVQPDYKWLVQGSSTADRYSVAVGDFFEAFTSPYETESISATWTFSNTDVGVQIKAIVPRLRMTELAAEDGIEDSLDTDTAYWDQTVDGGVFALNLRDDDDTIDAPVYEFTRVGMTPTLGNFLTTGLEHNGSQVITEAGSGLTKDFNTLRLRDSGALSVLGRRENSTGEPGDIVAPTNSTVLRRAGDVLDFGPITSGYISDFAEASRDAAGAMFQDNSEIEFSYDDSLDATDSVDSIGGVTARIVRSINPTWTGVHTFTQPPVFSLGAANFAGPSVQIGLTTADGSAVTAMRSDAAPALSQAIAPTWTANHGWVDNAEIRLGTGGDFRHYHDGTNNFIRADNGDIIVSFSGTERARFSSDASTYVRMTPTDAAGPSGLSAVTTGVYCNAVLQIPRVGSASNLRQGRVNGSFASPTVIQSSDALAQNSFCGWNGTAYTDSAAIVFRASELWSGTAQGTNFELSFCAAGSTTNSVKLRAGADSSGGWIRGQDGALAAPGWSFLGDTDTGWARTASNEITQVHGGAAILTTNANSQFINLTPSEASGITSLTNSAFSLYADRAVIVPSIGTDSIVRQVRINGSYASPTALLSGQGIGRYSSWAYNSSAVAQGGEFVFQGTEDWSTTANGTELLLRTVTTATTSLTTRMTLGGNSTGSYARGEAGAAAQPYWSFRLDTDTGLYSAAADTIGVSCGGTLRAHFSTTAFHAVTDNYEIQLGTGTAGVGDLRLYHDGTNSVIRNDTGALKVQQGATEVARFDSDSTAGNTRFMLYDVDNGTLERVSVGAADSGGTGFKVLRIPN